jgi:adenylosuccinate synthase
MGATIVVGAFWGDEGKGLISAYLGFRDKPYYVCRAGTGANAEHGLFLSDEKTYIKVNQLPLGWILGDNSILIGSGVAVDPVKLAKEVNKFKISEGQLVIDFRAPIIEQRHITAETVSKSMKSIGSTFSGTGYAKADFVLRKARQAYDIVDLAKYLEDGMDLVNWYAEKGNIIVESSQGTFLSLAVSKDYPNCTSDNVTAMAAADDVLLSWKHIKDVMLVVKTLPTREGSGSFGNSKEILETEMKDYLVEASSIGGVTRRKASGIDFDLLKYSVKLNGATQIALTFCDHYDRDIINKTSVNDITPEIYTLIDKIEKETDVPVTILNTGKPYWAIIDRTSDINLQLPEVEDRLLMYKEN